MVSLTALPMADLLPAAGPWFPESIRSPHQTAASRWVTELARSEVGVPRPPQQPPWPDFADAPEPAPGPPADLFAGAADPGESRPMTQNEPRRSHSWRPARGGARRLRVRASPAQNCRSRLARAAATQRVRGPHDCRGL